MVRLWWSANHMHSFWDATFQQYQPEPSVDWNAWEWVIVVCEETHTAIAEKAGQNIYYETNTAFIITFWKSIVLGVPVHSHQYNKTFYPPTPVELVTMCCISFFFHYQRYNTWPLRKNEINFGRVKNRRRTRALSRSELSILHRIGRQGSGCCYKIQYLTFR